MDEIMKTGRDLEAQNGASSGSGQEEEKDALAEPLPTAEVESVEHLNDTHKVSTDAPNPEEYDERAAKFWSVYVDEAEHHDKALIGTWKDDMEGVIVFAGLYSASLTAFLVESYKNLAPDPVQVNAYYTRQSVVLLAQISAQLAASGSPVPSAFDIPLQYPEFHARKSDVRINIYWFLSLVFSLTAALAATLVQQWVRDYMHVFQRYNHPLKRARIRQFLYEGAKRWHMAAVVDTIPALIHISLFLFFIGLAEFLFGLNTSTATVTTITTTICAILYFWSVIAPSLDPKSPYQSPLSGAFWRVFQRLRRRTHRDHSTGGDWRLVSTNMTDGRAQIPMDESVHRKRRDARAIGWVLGNLTEDSELEPFILGIPGLLSSRWGNRVWDAVAEGESNGNAIVHGADQLELPFVLRNPGHPTDQQATTTIPLRHDDTLHELGTGITRLLKTCTDPGILPTEDARRKRARACVDAALSLVLSTEHDWEWSAEPEILAQTLVYLGNVEKIREVPVGGFESAFATPWTCMSIIAVRKMLHTPVVHDAAQRVITCLVNVRGEGVDHADDEAMKTAGTIDQYLKACWESACTLHRELVREVETDKMEERCHEIMRDGSDDIMVLEDMWNRFGWAEEIDEAIISLVRTMIYASNGILEYLPDVVSPWQSDPRRVPNKGTRSIPPYLMPQFFPPRLLAQRLWLCVWTLRNISASGLVVGAHQPKSLGELSAPELQARKIRDVMDDTQAPIATQLSRLQDLRDGGLAYVLEIFIAAVKSTKSASHLLSQPLYIGTFHNITSDWTERRHAIWTQRLLVDLLRRVLLANDSPADVVPGYIIDEFLIFMGKVLAEEKGSNVTEAISLIEAYNDRRGGKHLVAQSVLMTISPPKSSKPPRPSLHHQAATV